MTLEEWLAQYADRRVTPEQWAAIVAAHTPLVPPLAPVEESDE